MWYKNDIYTRTWGHHVSGDNAGQLEQQQNPTKMDFKRKCLLHLKDFLVWRPPCCGFIYSSWPFSLLDSLLYFFSIKSRKNQSCFSRTSSVHHVIYFHSLTCKVKKREEKKKSRRAPTFCDGWCRNVTDIIITELTFLRWFFRFFFTASSSLDTICNIWHSIFGGYSTIVERVHRDDDDEENRLTVAAVVLCVAAVTIESSSSNGWMDEFVADSHRWPPNRVLRITNKRRTNIYKPAKVFLLFFFFFFYFPSRGTNANKREKHTHTAPLFFHSIQQMIQFNREEIKKRKTTKRNPQNKN